MCSLVYMPVATAMAPRLTNPSMSSIPNNFFGWHLDYYQELALSSEMVDPKGVQALHTLYTR